MTGGQRFEEVENRVVGILFFWVSTALPTNTNQLNKRESELTVSRGVLGGVCEPFIAPYVPGL